MSRQWSVTGPSVGDCLYIYYHVIKQEPRSVPQIRKAEWGKEKKNLSQEDILSCASKDSGFIKADFDIKEWTLL